MLNHPKLRFRELYIAESFLWENYGLNDGQKFPKMLKWLLMEVVLLSNLKYF